MLTRLERSLMVLAVLACGAGMSACGGGESDQQQLESAVDSLTVQRDSTIARMDSAGVVHADTLHRDSTADTTAARRTP
jgi:hypothetical protein